MLNSNMRIRGRRFLVFSFQFFIGLALTASAVIPPVEKILPDDTLLLVTTPDYAKLRDLYRSSPQSQFWDDPAMKPFRDKFVSKFTEELLQPLEKDLGIDLSDYTALPQGQITFAVTQNDWPAKEGQRPGVLFLLDTKDKSPQLMKNLADVRKKWIEAGKTLRTEKIRNLEFTVLPISDKDVPKTLRKFSNSESESDSSDTATNAPKNELFIGQFESLLIVGSAAKPIEKVLVHLTGGAMPSLGDLAVYDANRLSLFRDAPFYGWVNTKSFIDLLTHKQAKEDSDTPDPFSMLNPGKILNAVGVSSLKTIAFSVQMAGDGTTAQLFASMPESSRQGIFKVFPGEAKDSSPPSFVPGDAVKFQRWRMDGQKTWATLQKVLGDISPQATGGIHLMLETANAAAKQKDPDFDIDKNFFGNLGDDLINYEKAPRGDTLAGLNSAPSLFLIGSPNPDQFASALKYILVLASQDAGTPKEREFLGRKIYSVSLPGAPEPGANFSAAPQQRSLSYTASGGYVAVSTDASLVEEYLRSSDSQQKTLRETPGLTDAMEKVGGSSTGLFGFENQAETTRAVFEALRKSPATDAGSAAMVPGLGALPNAGKFRDWMDFSLLPPYEKISKYFGINVYAASANVDGLTFKMYAPAPAALKK